METVGSTVLREGSRASEGRPTRPMYYCTQRRTASMSSSTIIS